MGVDKEGGGGSIVVYGKLEFVDYNGGVLYIELTKDRTNRIRDLGERLRSLEGEDIHMVIRKLGKNR